MMVYRTIKVKHMVHPPNDLSHILSVTKGTLYRVRCGHKDTLCKELPRPAFVFYLTGIAIKQSEEKRK